MTILNSKVTILLYDYYKKNTLGGWEFGDTNYALGEVLKWDMNSEQWMDQSSIKPRFYHSVSVLPWSDVAPFCVNNNMNGYPNNYIVNIVNPDGSI